MHVENSKCVSEKYVLDRDTNFNGYFVQKNSIKDFWCTNINDHQICLKKDKLKYLKAKNPIPPIEFQALNSYLSSFSKRIWY